MNAYELADELNRKCTGRLVGFAAIKLRQQAQEKATLSDRIAELEHMNKNWQLSETMAYNRIAELEKENSELKYEKSSGVYDAEPVAWINDENIVAVGKCPKDFIHSWKPLYTTPQTKQCKDCGEINPAEIHTCSPQTKLSDEEILDLYVPENYYSIEDSMLIKFARAIEAKVRGEK